MLLSDGLINDNGISAIALAFFTALFAGLGLLFQQVYQGKQKAIEATDEAKKATANTQGVANGFASSMGSKLDLILEQQLEMEAALRDHLSWHLKKER